MHRFPPVNALMRRVARQRGNRHLPPAVVNGPVAEPWCEQTGRTGVARRLRGERAKGSNRPELISRPLSQGKGSQL